MKKKDDTKFTGEDRDYLKGKDLSREESIKRVKPPMINEAEDNFKFMQIDVDYYTNNKEFPRKYDY